MLMALCCSANNLALSSRERVGLTPGCSILTATALTGSWEMNTVIKEAEEVQLQLMITVRIVRVSEYRWCRCSGSSGWAGYKDSATRWHSECRNTNPANGSASHCCNRTQFFLSKVGFSIMMREVDRNVWLLLQLDFALGIIIILYY